MGPTNLDLLEPRRLERAAEFGFAQRSGDASGPRGQVGARLVVDVGVGDQQPGSDSSARA